MLSPVWQPNDLVHLPPSRPKNKTCSICRFPGHQRGSCPKINQFKKPPLEMWKEMHSRHELSMALSNVFWYKNNFRSKEDVRDISISIPTWLLGVVIHRRFFVNRNSKKMCLECTILGPTGDAHSTFQNYLFSTESMCSYVTRSKTNVVICEWEDDCTDGYESFGFAMSQPPPTIQQLSQSEQMGYGILGLSQTNQRGYGFTANGWSAPL